MGAMYSTLPEMFVEVVRSRTDSTIACYKDDQWQRRSYEALYDRISNLALGLQRLGLGHGDTVAIIAEPSPYWLMFDLAAMSVGAITIPIFAHIAPDIFQYQLEDADVRWCFVSGDEQWSLVQSVKQHWDVIITHDVPAQPEEHIYQRTTLMRAGEQIAKSDAGAYEKLLKRISPDDVATIIYTSGSTGMPKGVCLSQSNVVSQIKAAGERFDLEADKDVALSCLPLAHVFERMVMYFYLSKGISVYFADDIQRVGQLLKELKPTCMTMVPRLLEKVYAKILKKAEESNYIKWHIAQWAFSEARENDPVTSRDTWTFQIADHLVYQKLRDSLGGRLRYVIVGGARLSPDLQRFFINIGLPVFTGYGMSEASPVLTANYKGHNKIGTVGPVFPGVELRIGEKNEILARGPNIMQGYYNKPKETAEVINSDGWLHTGDCGSIDDEGYLSITGRIKELLKTSNGKYVAPVPIEQRLCESPIIDMAMIVAEGRTFVSCLLFADLDILKQIKADSGHEQLEDAAFLETPFFQERMQGILDTVNQELNHWEQVRKYKFVLSAPSIEGEELTPTMKIRRHIIEEKYSEIIESLYQEAHHG